MVIILQKFFHHIPELGLRCQNKVIQTILLEGLYKGFHVAVTLRRSRRDRFCLAPNRMNNVLEALAEQRIAVMDKILLPQQLSIPHIALVPGNLRHPVPVGIMDYASQPDLAGKYIFKKQYMLTLQSMRRYQLICGKVAGSNNVLVGIEEHFPIAVCSSIGRREISVFVHDPLYSHEGDLISQVNSVVPDALVAPGGILFSQAEDQFLQLIGDRFSSSGFLVWTGAVVFIRNQLAVPAHNC